MNMNRIKPTKKDPPSAASMILGSESTPTFSLNSRQLEILANREKHRAEGNDHRPFATRSNRQSEPMNPPANLAKDERRSLLVSRSRHSMVSHSTRQSASTEDGGLLRRILEKANQNALEAKAGGSSRQSVVSRASSATHSESSYSSQPRTSRLEAPKRSERSRFNASRKMEPDDTSKPRGKDPVELKSTHSETDRVMNSRTKADGESNEHELAVTDPSTQLEIKDHPDIPHVNTNSTNDGSVELVLSTNQQDMDMNISKNDSDKSIGSSVRRKFGEKKRGSQSKIKSVFSISPRKQAQKNAAVASRQQIQERMHQRKKTTARVREEVAPDDEEYDAFFQTLQKEALVSNSQLWRTFAAVMEGRRPKTLVSKKLSKVAKFDPNTKVLLKTMNAHLRGMSHTDTRNKTQLVDDRTIEKELSQGGQSFLRSVPLASKLAAKRLSAQKKEKTEKHSSALTPPKLEENSSSGSPMKETDSNSQLPDPDKDQTADQRTASSDADVEKNQEETSAETSTTLDQETKQTRGETSTETSTLLDQETKQTRATPIDRKVEKEDKSGTPKKAESEPSIPWTDVKLRSVGEALSPSTSNSGAPPLWTSLSLKKVPRAKTDEPASSQIPEPIDAEMEILKLDAMSHTESQPSIINVHETTIPRTNKSRAEYVVFTLDTSDGEPEQRIVIERKTIKVVQGQTSAESTLWQVPRETTQPVAFDMPSRQVRLETDGVQEQRVLQFRNSADCLQFTNLFYQESETPTSAGSIEQGDDDFASIRMEYVNDEERSLLQKFRSMNKNDQEAFQETIVKKDDNSTDKEQVQQAVDPRKVLNESLLQRLKPQLGNTPPEFISTAEMPTSPVSTMTDADHVTVKMYKKLLKVGVPSEGVLDKMQKDNVDERIINCVLGEGTSENPDPKQSNEKPSIKNNDEGDLSKDEADLVAKYKKMLSFGLPIEAVRHKMMQEQVDQKIVDIVDKPPSTKTADDSSNQLSEEEEKKASKYRKMLKIGLDAEAVRHGMMKDQIDEKIVAAVLGEAPKGPHKSDEKVEASRKKEAKKNELSKEEEAQVKQYKRFLKLQVPKDQLESRMRQEGASEKVIASVLGIKMAGGPQQNGVASTQAKGSKLVSLHWTPLSEDQLNNSVWEAAKALKTEDADPSKLVELFQKKPKTAKPKTVGNDDSASVSSKVQLIDLNRSNNIAISLKAFKDFSYKELSDIIKFLDPCRRLEGERIPFLRDLLPTPTEVKAIKDYSGPDNRLVPAEKWFRQIATIKRIDVKVRVMRTMEMLQVEAREVGNNLALFTRVCNQVMDSRKLQDLLGMVLAIGNIMNEGTRTGGASGFKFDSLLKLTQTKSTDGTTTVLDYLVTLYVGKDERETLDLISDFPDCQLASRMLVSDLNMEVKSIQESLDQCKSELTNLKNETARGSNHKPNAPMNKIKPGLDPKAALLQSITNRGLSKAVQKVEDSEPNDGHNLKETEYQADTQPSVLKEISRIESADKNSIYGAIERLEKFIEVASTAVADLENLKKEANSATRDVSKFCGEGNNSGATSTLLGILAQFASNIEEALKKFDRKRAAEAKRKKAKVSSGQSVSESTMSSSQSVSESTNDGKSLVLMVNNWLKQASEKTKEEYKKGFYLENPTTQMQEIYKGERKNLASVLQEKSEGVDQGEVKLARKKFGSPEKPKKSLLHGAKRPQPSPETKQPHEGGKSQDQSTVSLIAELATFTAPIEGDQPPKAPVSATMHSEVEMEKKPERSPAPVDQLEKAPLREESDSSLNIESILAKSLPTESTESESDHEDEHNVNDSCEEEQQEEKKQTKTSQAENIVDTATTDDNNPKTRLSFGSLVSNNSLPPRFGKATQIFDLSASSKRLSESSTGSAYSIKELARIRRAQKSPGRRQSEANTAERREPSPERRKSVTDGASSLKVSLEEKLAERVATLRSDSRSFSQLATQKRLSKHGLKDTASVGDEGSVKSETIEIRRRASSAFAQKARMKRVARKSLDS